ncbi:unnamed protein product [Citrullus colocynthis]|uniref:F-box domain-containing protein n=1 Tax=Citrullus colocynthis TaxID=252529 RepID=A0ABP0ZBK4_9ROSI
MEELEIRTMDWGTGLPPLIGKAIFAELVISNFPVCRLVSKLWNQIVLNRASSSTLQFLTNDFLLCTSDRVPNCQFTGLRNPNMHCINLETTKHLDVAFDLELVPYLNQQSK